MTVYSVWKYFVEKVCICVQQGRWSLTYFVVAVTLFTVGIKVTLASRMSVVMFLPFLFYGIT
jgi:hypothetical protein